MAKKPVVRTEVVRLTKQESDLITAIRDYGVENVLIELNQAITLDVDNKVPILTKMVLALRTKRMYTLDELTSTGVITPTDAEKITNAMNTDQNIAILGEPGSGKTTLLNTLVCNVKQEGQRICILEDTPELEIKKCTQENAILQFKPLKNLYTSDMIDILFRGSTDKIIFSEVNTSEDILTLVTALQCSYSTIFTMSTNQPFHEAVSILFGTTRFEASSVITNANFLVIRCSKTEDGEHRIAVEENQPQLPEQETLVLE